jgi:hypothetical protein
VSLIEGWLSDVLETVANNIESYKKSYENLEHFNELVENELGELLSDVSRNKFMKNLKINDDLDIYKNLEDLFRENEIQDQSNFWNLARGSAYHLLINYGKTIYLKWTIFDLV